jgi:hypothetical protein
MTSGRLHSFPNRPFHGKILCSFKNKLISSRGASLYMSTDNGMNWHKLLELPLSLKSYIQALLPISRRLFRQDVHHVVPLSDSVLVAFAFKNIFVCNYRDGKVLGTPTAIIGSRPLSVCLTPDHNLYYGEYHGNPDRKPTNIFCSKDNGFSWFSVYQMEDIRHVHGVFHDPYTNALWVTTGDTDEECGIWTTINHFKTLDRVAGGSQNTRAITLLFTQSHIYFGSDIPHKANSIYRFERRSGRIDKLQEVEGPVFWGCKIGNALFFSTAVEPSQINTSRSASLWCSLDGVSWSHVSKFRKDIWPMKLFQYGQILFPFGENTTDDLFITPYATEMNNTVQRIKITNLF